MKLDTTNEALETFTLALESQTRDEQLLAAVSALVAVMRVNKIPANEAFAMIDAALAEMARWDVEIRGAKA